MLGDAVNVASRLEGLTRELGCCTVLSDDLVTAARAQDAEAAAALLSDFEEAAPQDLRNRAEPVKIWASSSALPAGESRRAV